MNAQTESKPVVLLPDVTIKVENPMQERYCGQVVETGEATAEAILTARRLEPRGEAGPVFVP